MTARLDALERLQRLREAGALTEREFAAEKQRVLVGGGESRDPRYEVDEYEDERAPRWRACLLPALGLLAAAGAAAWFASEEFGELRPPPSNERSVARPKAPTPVKTAEKAPPAPGGLAPVLAFKDPAACEYSDGLQRLFDELTKWDEDKERSVAGKPMRVAGFPAPIAPAFTRSDEGRVTASLPIAGQWYGLKVSRLYTAFREESDDIGQQIRFLEEPARVRDVLNVQGFDLPPVGQTRTIGANSPLPVAISVQAVPGGAALSCAT